MSVIKISEPVGAKARNKDQDVINIQVMLNHFIGLKLLQGYKPLGIDGDCGPKTREAISAFQFQNFLFSEEHFHGQIWPKDKTIEFMNKKAGHIPKIPSPTDNDPKADAKLLDLLWGVDTDKLSHEPTNRKHLAYMRRFFIRGLEGAGIDDRYWSFTYYDGFGRPRRCNENHSVDSLVRGTITQKALSVFRRTTNGLENIEEIGKALKEIEKTVACNTLLLVRWYHHNSAHGDAPIDNFTEMTYLKEVTSLAVRSQPESIYAVYADELTIAYRVMRPFLTADALWKMRRAGGK